MLLLALLESMLMDANEFGLMMSLTGLEGWVDLYACIANSHVIMWAGLHTLGGSG